MATKINEHKLYASKLPDGVANLKYYLKKKGDKTTSINEKVLFYKTFDNARSSKKLISRSRQDNTSGSNIYNNNKAFKEVKSMEQHHVISFDLLNA